MIENIESDVRVSYGNEILYRMCSERPDHKDRDTVASKIWIIGRAYAAAIERGAGERIEEGKDFCQDIVAPDILKEPIDDWIAQVSSIKRLTVENIGESLRCHKKVMDLFRTITRGATKRSLASKYLHFHARHAFFIYDSRAIKKIKAEIKAVPPEIETKLDSQDFDPVYADFCARCLIYREKLENGSDEKISPRMLDMKLLGYKL